MRSIARCWNRSFSCGTPPGDPICRCRPEKVTVYALPGLPFLVGYQNGDCVIAFLAVERQRLLQLLRPQIGWSV